MQDGRRSGLRRQRKLSVQYSINHMDHWMQVGPRDPRNLRYVLVNHLPILKSYVAVLETTSSVFQNIFDNLPALQALKPSELRGELDRYLATDPVNVSDALAWWHEQRHVFPRLHRMALDYLSIPGTGLSCCNARRLLTITFSHLG